MTSPQYVDLLVECDLAKTNLDEAISQGQSEDGVATLYRRYLDLLTRKKAAIVNEIPDPSP